MAWDDTLEVLRLGHHARPGRRGDGRDDAWGCMEFEAMVASGEMLDDAEVFGNSTAPLARWRPRCRQGATRFSTSTGRAGSRSCCSALAKDVVSIFILPPSIAALESRLRGRGQDSEEVIAGRMAKSRDEISHWGEYDYVIIHRDLDAAEDELKTILRAERARADRQPGLTEFVRGLNREFDNR